MYDIVCPGLTKERGLTLFELFAATFMMIKAETANIMNKKANADPALPAPTTGSELLNYIFRQGTRVSNLNVLNLHIK